MTEIIYGIPVEDYEKLSKVDLSPYARQKQNLTYIPWGVSLQILKTYDSTLGVEFERTKYGKLEHGSEQEGYLVICFLTRNGRRISSNLYHAVRDYKNKAIKKGIEATHVTNSVQRAIAKCVAINTGIGMSLYSQIDESLDFIEEGQVVGEKPYKSWRSLEDVVRWAVSYGCSSKEAEEMFKAAPGSSNLSKAKNFYEKILKTVAEEKTLIEVESPNLEQKSSEEDDDIPLSKS